MRLRPIALTFGLACFVHAGAVLRIPALFGDNMVLQQGPATPVYGFAAPGEIVKVAAGQHIGSATADKRGRWRVELNLPAAEGPFDLEISTLAEHSSFHNVVVGEVWVCSGQSNMEWSYHDAKLSGQPVEIGDPSRPQLRLFQVRHTISDFPRHELQGKWVVSSPTAMNNFSLLGYLFGTGLVDRLKCPVGIVESDWGGTPLEAWTPESVLGDPDPGSPLATTSGAGTNGGPKFKPERARAVLFNGMMSPVLSFGFRGVAWYQGESNIGRAEQYRRLFPAMISSWRQEAGHDFPFLFVQLANHESPKNAPTLTSEWAELRAAQAEALKLPDTAMATAIDLARRTDIHRLQRNELGKRLVWLAMSKVYDRRLPSLGPTYKRHVVTGSEIRVEFEGKINGLVIRSEDGLSGFEVAGDDRVFHRAYARISDGSVIVWCPQVPHPVAVRYAWADDPDASLYNSAGLPALPFRTDDWEDSRDQGAGSRVLDRGVVPNAQRLTPNAPSQHQASIPISSSRRDRES